MKTIWWFLVLVFGLSVVPASGNAQLPEGAVRLSFDVDTLSVAWVRLNPEGPEPPRNHTVVGLGMNQLGASQLTIPSSPLGFGLGYVLGPKWLIGARAGFGYDHVSEPDDAALRYLTWTFMPGVTYVPFGERAKFFVNFSPLLEYTQQKQGSARRRQFNGCYSIGAGEMWFVTRNTSIDIGAYFEGRFPHLVETSLPRTYVSDLRWLIRVGVSLWT